MHRIAASELSHESDLTFDRSDPGTEADSSANAYRMLAATGTAGLSRRGEEVWEDDPGPEEDEDGEYSDDIEEASERSCTRMPYNRKSLDGCHLTRKKWTCPDTHLYCLTEEVVLEEAAAVLYRAVDEHDGPLLAAVMAQSRSTLRLNSRRSSVQVVDCVGRVVANVPVSKVLLAYLQ